MNGNHLRSLRKIGLTAAALVLSSFVAAQTNLPPQVQADLLQNQIAAAAKANDSRGVLAKIDEYKKLPVSMPPALLLVEAKAAQATKDSFRAFTALQSFLAVAKRETPGYEEGLALYPEYETAAKPSLQAHEALTQQSFSAAEKGDIALLTKLPPTSLNAKDADGWTPLAFASAAGQIDAVKFLLGKGVDINAQNNKGMTPLMLAVVSKKTDIVTLLRSQSADAGIKNAAGASTYELALKSGDAAVISAVTHGMTKIEYLTNLADLKPDYVPGQANDEEQTERLELVNPVGVTRNMVLRMLIDSNFLPIKAYQALPDDTADSLKELENIMRRYSQSKGLAYDHVTVGHLLRLLSLDVNKAYDVLWQRIRAATGPLAGQGGLYMGATPMNSCVSNNVNLYVWSEGDTIIFAKHPSEETWGLKPIVKRGGEVTTKLKSGDGSTQKLTQLQYFIQDTDEHDKPVVSWVKVGQEYLEMAVDGPVWHRCKQ